jgi:hypothetical protein
MRESYEMRKCPAGQIQEQMVRMIIAVCIKGLLLACSHSLDAHLSYSCTNDGQNSLLPISISILWRQKTLKETDQF